MTGRSRGTRVAMTAMGRREELTLVSSLAGEDGSRQTLSLSGAEEARVHVIRYDP